MTKAYKKEFIDLRTRRCIAHKSEKKIKLKDLLVAKGKEMRSFSF